jgi:hypothetical protein
MIAGRLRRRRISDEELPTRGRQRQEAVGIFVVSGIERGLAQLAATIA